MVLLAGGRVRAFDMKGRETRLDELVRRTEGFGGGSDGRKTTQRAESASGNVRAKFPPRIFARSASAMPIRSSTSRCAS
jgi:hypothetical protein